ncbi:MAG: hypothetical protein ACE5GH_07145, partial [Fidelibacterota bacterium]
MIDRVARHLYIFSLMSQLRPAIPLLLLGLLVSCEPPVQSVDETDPITDVSFSYLQDDGKIFVSARIKDPFNGVKLNFVQLIWYGINGLSSDNPDSVFLNDNGDFGDILRGDHVYSRKQLAGDLDNPVIYGDTGTVYLRIGATYVDDQSHVLADSFGLGNIIPRIDSVEAPDTLQIPTSGIATDTIRVKVTDPDGLEDIQWVGFRSLKPDGTYAN